MTTAQAEALRRGTRIVAGIAVVLLLPRIVVAWFVLDRTPAPVIASLLFVLGVLLAGMLLNRALVQRLGSRWWVALLGLAGLVAGALATSGVTALGGSVAVAGYRGWIAPPQVALTNWLFLAALAVWLLGAELLVLSALAGLTALMPGSRRGR
ncbi:MAG: hypothetical protein ACTHJL_00045 [Amnibacterium sp.]